MNAARWTRSVLLPGAGLLALSMVAFPLVASAADTPESSVPVFGGNFEMDLGAAPIRVTFDRPFLFHPVLDLQMFPSSAILTSLDARQGSASLVGFGAAETAGGLLGQVIPGNAEDAASTLEGVPGLLGLPLPAVPRRPLPSDPFPPIPVPVPPPAPNTVNTNFPFTPDAQTGFGTFDGGGVMRSSSGTAESHAAADSVNSQASAVAVTSSLLGPSGVLSVGAMRSITDGLVRAGNVRGTATSILNDIDILGVITIDHLKSVTTLVGDGQKSSSTSSVTLGGVTALGYPAVIDSQGITISNIGVVPDSTIASLNSQLHQMLNKAGLTISLAKDSAGKAPADATTRAVSESAGLNIDIVQSPPSDVPVAGGSTTTVKIGLGHSRGSVLTGPDLSGGAAVSDTAAGTGVPGAVGATSPEASDGVDSAAVLPSLGDPALGAPVMSTGGSVAVAGSAAPGTRSNQRFTSLDADLASVPGLSNTRLGWVAIWPLLLVIAIAAAVATNNHAWARAGRTRVAGASASSPR